MFNALKARLFQGYRTNAFPDAPPKLPARFRGRPEVDPDRCMEAAPLCPTGAIRQGADGRGMLDLGRCIFCGKCSGHGVAFSLEYRMGVMHREGLIADGTPFSPEEQRNAGIRALCGRSLKIRQVSAGGCAACELDFNVLGTLAWDMGRFGIQVVASPRHADCLLVTGPVSCNMLEALKKCRAAVPEPAFVIACGACAISGGLYAGNPEVKGGLEGILPVDLYVPGCPPHPATLLEALVRFIGRRCKDNQAG